MAILEVSPNLILVFIQYILFPATRFQGTLFFFLRSELFRKE